MAETRKSPGSATARGGKHVKAPQAASRPTSQRKDDRGPKGPNWMLVAVVIAAAAIIGAIVIAPSLAGSVPFSTFKSAFQSAASVSIVATFSNASQYSNESPCISKMVQVIAYTRKDSTIGIFFINSQNDSCTYQQALGMANPRYGSASMCAGLAYSHPSITLNYSSTNSTAISASRMSVYGNSAYMEACPIAVELS